MSRKTINWQPIETAPKDGTRFIGRALISGNWIKRRTFYGKTSHVPLYGWCHGRHPEDIDLWQPAFWIPLT